MTSRDSSGRPTDLRDGHTTVLRTLDPDDADLTDLEPLRAVIADSRVVGQRCPANASSAATTRSAMP